MEIIKHPPAKELKDLDRSEVNELGSSLYSLLTKSKYLIVLDDLTDFVLDINCLLSHFPDNGVGSRVIVTSREVLLSMPWGHHWASRIRLGPLDKECNDKLLWKTQCMDDEGVTETPMKLLVMFLFDRGVILYHDRDCLVDFLYLLEWY